jgi:Tol biopolymer transport system component
MERHLRRGTRASILAGVLAIAGTLAAGAAVREQRFVDQLVAAGIDGAPVGQPMSDNAVSGDGRFVAFVSRAANLVEADENGEFDVFVRDRWKGTTELISVAANGHGADGLCTSPSISADGRFVAFSSLATNLGNGDNNRQFDLFVRDRELGVTQRISTSEDGTEADGSSVTPSISVDGRFVAFASSATNLVPFDTNGKQDIFVRDLQTGTIDRFPHTGCVAGPIAFSWHR